MTDTVRRPHPLSWVAFMVCTLIWGSTFLVIRIGNDSVPPLWAASIRLALATIVLVVLARIIRQPLPRGAALRTAAAYGFFTFGLNFALLYWGEINFPSGLAAVLFATIPLSTSLIARAFGIERLSGRRIIGAMVALTGVAVLFAGRDQGRASLTHALAIVGAATFASVAGVLLKRGPRQPPIPANAVACAVGLPICLAASFALGEPHAIPRTVAEWGPILYLTLAGSVIAFVLFAWLVHQWDISKTSFIAVVNPITALTLGLLVRNETLGVASIVGTLLVLIGVFVGVRATAASVSAAKVPGPAPAAAAPATPESGRTRH